MMEMEEMLFHMTLREKRTFYRKLDREEAEQEHRLKSMLNHGKPEKEEESCGCCHKEKDHEHKHENEVEGEESDGDECSSCEDDYEYDSDQDYEDEDEDDYDEEDEDEEEEGNEDGEPKEDPEEVKRQLEAASTTVAPGSKPVLSDSWDF